MHVELEVRRKALRHADGYMTFSDAPILLLFMLLLPLLLWARLYCAVCTAS